MGEPQHEAHSTPRGSDGPVRLDSSADLAEGPNGDWRASRFADVTSVRRRAVESFGGAAMDLKPRELALVATDLAWAFGLRNEKGAKLAFSEPRGEREAAALRGRLESALEGVRPSPGAPSLGDVLGALRAGGGALPKRARRRLAVELDAIVAMGTHRRAKRQERRRILASLVVLYGLEEALGAAPSRGDLDARRAAAAETFTRALRE